MKATRLCLLAIVLATALAQNAENHHENGAQFLRQVIGQLRQDNIEIRNVGEMDRISEISGPTPLPQYNNYHYPGQHSQHNVQHHHHHDGNHPNHHEEVKDVHSLSESVDQYGNGNAAPPPPPLSKEELATLYEEALKKGATLDLTNGGPLEGGLPDDFKQQLGLDDENAQGYYYYFYPLKDVGKEKEKAEEAMMAMATANSEKRVEPLFVAMSGFIGMALVFVVSVLFLPKFGNLQANRNKVPAPAMKSSSHELNSLTRLVVQSINGKDCTARIACEVGRAMRKMQINNKPLRMLEIMLPPGIGKQIQRIRQSSSQRNRCHMPCRLSPTVDVKPKLKPKPKPNQKQLNKNNKMKQN